LVCGILLIVLAGTYLIMSTEFEIGFVHGVPGPGMIPFMLALLLLLLSALYVIRTWKLTRSREEKFWTGDVRSLAICAAMYLCYILLLEKLGFILTTLLFGFITLKFVFKMRWFQSLLASVVLTFVFHVGFYNFLDVPLPKGLGWKVFSVLGIVTAG